MVYVELEETPLTVGGDKLEAGLIERKREGYIENQHYGMQSELSVLQ